MYLSRVLVLKTSGYLKYFSKYWVTCLHYVSVVGFIKAYIQLASSLNSRHLDHLSLLSETLKCAYVLRISLLFFRQTIEEIRYLKYF